MSVVIWEHENFRGRTEKRYQIMQRVSNGLNHVFSGVCFTLEEAKKKCADNNYNIQKIGTFYEIV